MNKLQLLTILQSCILFYEGYSHADLISIGLDKRDALIGIQLCKFLEQRVIAGEKT